MQNGFTDAVIVWLNHGVIVDGHNRHRIWRDVFNSDEDKAPEIREMAFADRDAVKEFMINRQLSRRNVTDAMRVKIALKLKPIIEARAKEKQVQGGKAKVVLNSAQPQKTRDEVAKAAGVGHDTVRKVEAVLNSDNEEIKAAMLAPKSDPKHVSIHAAHEQVKAASKPPRRFCRVAFLDDVWVALFKQTRQRRSYASDFYGGRNANL